MISFFTSFRLGPDPNLRYVAGNAAGQVVAAFLFPSVNFAGASWTNRPAATIEAETSVADIIAGISTNNAFFLDSIRLTIPNGEASPTTLEKLGLTSISILSGKKSGKMRVTRIPFTAAYNQENEQDRVFEFPVKRFFNQFTGINFITGYLVNNWLDVPAIPLAVCEFRVSLMNEKIEYVA